MVMANTGVQPMTTGDSIELISSTVEDNNLSPTTETSPPLPHDWLAPLPTSADVGRGRHTDVSKDPRYNH